MNFFEKILKALDGRMTTPTPYGWFHILALVIAIGLCVFVAIKARKTSDKQNRIILIVVSSVMILLEVYKQLNFSFNSVTGEWGYQWYAFPFQFCSTPMYIMLLAGLVKKGKFQDFLFSFLGTFCLFAGLVVMLYPSTVFIDTIGINIQTMIHHGGMLVIGVYMLSCRRTKLQHKTILKAAAVFTGLVVIALGLNLLAPAIGIVTLPDTSLGHTFDMFFISPYFECTLPVLSLFNKAPYIIFLLIYILGFTLAAYLILLIAMGFNKLIHFIKSRKEIVINDNKI